MQSLLTLAMAFVLSLISLAAAALAQEALPENAPPEARRGMVELRWVETRHIDGLTEDEGFQSSCDPDSIVYPHKEAALVLTSAEVAEARLTHHDFSANGLSSENYMVELHLTPEARKTLAASRAGNEMRLLTVVVLGRHWGLHRYEVDKEKPFVPEQARAESFVASVGFFSSRHEAEQLVKIVQAKQQGTTKDQ